MIGGKVKHPIHKYAKSRYRIGNWPEYEAGLRRRGDLTVKKANLRWAGR
jgi:hypothetical protein